MRAQKEDKFDIAETRVGSSVDKLGSSSACVRVATTGSEEERNQERASRVRLRVGLGLVNNRESEKGKVPWGYSKFYA